MKKLISYLFALLLMIQPVFAADFSICTCEITNAPTVHGNTITVKGSTRAWTNNVVTPSSQILTNSTIGGSATNLFNQFGTYRIAGVTTERSGTNAVKFLGFDLTASVSAGWATMTCVTNVSTNAWQVAVPFEIMAATNRTIVGSQLVLDLTQYSTNAFNQNSNVTSELVGLTNAQTISIGRKFFTGPNIHSNAVQQWIGGTNSSYIGRMTNGFITNVVLHSPTITNGINYGNAFSSIGSGGSGSQQFGTSASASGSQSTALGFSTTASGDSSLALGASATASGDSGIGIGQTSTASEANSIAIGSEASASATASIAIGALANASHDNSIAIGTEAATTEANQAVIGSTSVDYIYLFGRVFSTVGYTNATMIGTNVVTAGIHFTRLNNTSLANGNNAAVDIGGTAGGSRTYVRVSGPTAAFNINGIAGGANGRYLILHNHSGQSMTIVNDSGVDPTAANRIYTGIGASVTITNNPGIAEFIYDDAQARWIYNNTTGTSIAGTPTFNDNQFISQGSLTNIKSGALLTNITHYDTAIFVTNVNIGGNLVVTNSITNSALTASRFVVADSNKKHVSTATSSVLASTLSDETGTGSAVFSDSPTFTGTVNAGAITASTVSLTTLLFGSFSASPSKMIYKTADETVIDTTLQDDDALQFNVSNGEIITFEIHAFVTGGADGIKATMHWDAGGSPTFVVWKTQIMIANTFSLHQVNTTLDTTDTLATVDADTELLITGTISASDDAIVSLQWAKNSDVTTDTTIRKGSFIRITKPTGAP